MSDFSPVLSASLARGAYGSARALQGGPAAPQPIAQQGGETFAEMVGKAATDAIHSTRQAEATVQAGLAGKVDTQSVVEATMSLESTVKVGVAVRNKLVEAYQQIMQMPI